MKKAFVWTTLCMVMFLGVVSGCSKGAATEEEVSVAQARAWLKAGEATPMDVNTEEVREEYGLLPGAILLPSASAYEAAMLPEDKGRKLVFYCFNRLCTASHVAAKRARGFGHKNVHVMTEGIKVWRETQAP